MSAPLPDEEPTATIGAPQRTASQLGFVPRHAAPTEPGVAGPVVPQQSTIADVHPRSDPWGSGLSAGESSSLFNRTPRRGGGGFGGAIGTEEGPLDLSGVHDVIAGNPSSEYDKPGGDEAPAEEQPRQAYPGAADPPSQGVYNVGGRLTHIRMTGPSTGGSTGRYATVTDLGDA